jgi:REP element-mobilizing transposase RayT
MARPLRIEYPGATYHVMARGNQGRAIFQDDPDRQRFLETLGEACDKTGWRIHAFVLMGNHYHALAETPEANLVAGMKWLQGTYTQRYNYRHKVHGHLFQGRYKAVPVEASNPGYLEAVSSYIHLNPARSGLIEIGKEKLKRYRWSSYPLYLSAPKAGPNWLERQRVMGALRLEPKDRRAYEAYLEGRVLELGLKAGRAELDEQWKALRRGRPIGGRAFAERIRNQIDDLMHGFRRESHSGPLKQDHSEQAAAQLLPQGLATLGLKADNLASLPKTAPTKAALAQWLRERTTVSLRWVGAHLEMGHYTNASGGRRKMNPTALRQFHRAKAKLDLLETPAPK